MQNRPSPFALILIAGVLLLPVTALGGFGDKEKPLLDGTDKSSLVYTISGVHNNTTAGIATYVSCTSREKGETFDPDAKVIKFGVEFFSNGVSQNDLTLGEGVQTLTPGDTDNIATGPIGSIVNDDIGAGNINGIGAARVFSTSSAIICAAFIIDTANPPSFITSLPMFRKGKQRGN